MDFGIWVEPEMVNPDSNLYREHPNWVYRFKNRSLTTARNQLVLNLTMKEVEAYILDFMDRLLRENSIKYIKWDMNRPFSEAGALNLPLEAMKSLWLLHTEAVYRIVDRLKEKYSDVHFEACASGGGRVDLGALSHFDSFWPSDNTDALDRLLIQESYSLMYPIKAMRAWVTDCPNFLDKRTIPLEFRFNCAMMSALGIGGDLSKWDEVDLEFASMKVEEYKKIRDIVQFGKIYRLSSISEKEIHAVQYVKDKGGSAVFLFLRGQSYGNCSFRIKLKGLEEHRKYIVQDGNICTIKSGAYLMNSGIIASLSGDYASKILKLNAAESMA